MTLSCHEHPWDQGLGTGSAKMWDPVPGWARSLWDLGMRDLGSVGMAGLGDIHLKYLPTRISIKYLIPTLIPK